MEDGYQLCPIKLMQRLVVQNRSKITRRVSKEKITEASGDVKEPKSELKPGSRMFL